jgi:hypothetical protein
MGGSTSTANAFDTTQLSDGSHQVAARVTLSDGSTQTVQASFTVGPESNDGYQLMVSTSSNRSGATGLQGQSLAGDVYIFLTPETNVNSVAFSIDGSAKSNESAAPYDLMGGSTSTARPLDTSGLADGQHEVVGQVTLTDGSTATVRATFTSNN